MAFWLWVGIAVLVFPVVVMAPVALFLGLYWRERVKNPRPRRERVHRAFWWRW